MSRRGTAHTRSLRTTPSLVLVAAVAVTVLTLVPLVYVVVQVVAVGPAEAGPCCSGRGSGSCCATPRR